MPRTGLLAALTTVVALSLCVTGSVARADSQDGVRLGASFILSTQQPDGGFGPPGQTLDAVFALRAAGIDPATVTKEGKTPVDYLESHAAEAAAQPGLAAKAALGAIALGLDPHETGGVDLIAAVEAGRDKATGRYGGDAFTQSIAILGLACTGNPVHPTAVTALAGDRVEGGGWGFGGAADPDTTAIAVQALIAAGVPLADPALAAGLAYLTTSQLDDGGWGYGESNASSTAFAVQAILAAGEEPTADSYRKPGGSPLAYLAGQQGPAGSFAGFDPAFATNQVLPALAGRTFCNAPNTPIRAVADPTPAAPSPTPGPPSTGQGVAARDRGMANPPVLLPGGLLIAAVLAAAACRAIRHPR